MAKAEARIVSNRKEGDLLLISESLYSRWNS